LPWPVIRIGALFLPTWAALLEMRYLWDTAHALDNRKLVALLGAEPHTPFAQAVSAALNDLGFIKDAVAVQASREAQ
jgi:nucleoside-diphosphate-sugar epimerase